METAIQIMEKARIQLRVAMASIKANLNKNLTLLDNMRNTIIRRAKYASKEELIDLARKENRIYQTVGFFQTAYSDLHQLYDTVHLLFEPVVPDTSLMLCIELYELNPVLNNAELTKFLSIVNLGFYEIERKEYTKLKKRDVGEYLYDLLSNYNIMPDVYESIEKVFPRNK